MDHPKQPNVFTLPWRVKIGPLTEIGRGLLTDSAHSNRRMIDEFCLLMPDYTITVNPKLGLILKDSKVDVKTNPGELLWGRTMRFERSGDGNTSPAGCIWYFVGIKNESGKFGYRVFEDGRNEKGLL